MHTVYVIKTEKGALLIDTATYDTDVTSYIIPFLNELGIGEDELKYIFITHDHGDHSGGLAEIMKHYPNAVILSRALAVMDRFENYKVISPTEGEIALDVIRFVPIVGHSLDSCAVLDTRSEILICGDSL